MSTPALYLAAPCSTCKAAPGQGCRRMDGKPTRRPHPKRTPDAPCGTYGGYQRHKKASETPCEDCRTASAAYMRQWRQRTGDVSNRRLMNATSKALYRLKAQHPDEFESLLIEELTA